MTKRFCAVESQSAAVRDRVRAMLPPPTLRCRDLERYLGEDESRVHALRGVSLDLEPGTVHAVVGPSGCGKSTLLYILGLLDRPDGGWVEIETDAVSQLGDDELARRRTELIGFIFQFHFLLEEFTAEENIMIPMRRLGRLNEEEMRARALELLDGVGLAKKAARPGRHLSGGEQQRVAVARALANDPRIILADEPTGNLDSANSRRAFELLQRIVQEKQKALLLVTHNPEIAEACDWIHEMQDGEIIGSHPRGAPARAR
ncbi:MAG: ABC transporter ATP-binding protein [Chthoniobacterales bacterium]